MEAPLLDMLGRVCERIGELHGEYDAERFAGVLLARRADAFAGLSGGPQGEVAGIERDSWLGIHRALFPLNVPMDYVHIDHISAERLRQYKLVFFPYPLMLPEAAAPVLRDYVAAGGALVAEARLGLSLIHI